MLEYSEMPPLSRIYHEAFLISAVTGVGENPSSSSPKLPVQPVKDTELQPSREQELPSTNPKPNPPGQKRPRRGPAQLDNPDPILPGLQIKLSQDYQVKIIVSTRCGNQWMGPTA